MIHEDSDDIGYWTGGHDRKPQWWREAGPMVSSLIVCNSIVPPEDQAIIVDAAVNADEGHYDAAEELRRFANYDNLDTRYDADFVVH